MAHSGDSLKAILASNEYTRIPDVPLFDAHDEYDKDGNLIRSFSEKRLQAICDHNNKRAEERGNLATFGPGHTIEDAPETMQPTHWAYAHNWHVKPFVKPDGTLGLPTIHADAYVKPVVEDHEGKQLNGIDAFRSMPHRSIELWTVDPDGKRIPGYVDHIALLRQTPKRDLGFLAFQKGKAVSLPAGAKLYGGPARTKTLTAAERGGKLFYSMESCNMDPTLPADAMAPDQAFMDKVRQVLMSIPGLAALMAPPPAPPAPPPPPAMDAPGGDAPLPGGLDAPGGDAPMPDKDDKPIPFSKSNPRSAENRLAYLEKQNRELADQLKAITADKAKEREDFSKANAEDLVDQLERDGHILDRDVEVEYFSKLPLGEKRKQRFDYLKRITRTGHGSDIPPSGFLSIDSPGSGSEIIDNEPELKEALRYSKANKCTFAEAQAKLKQKRA